MINTQADSKMYINCKGIKIAYFFSLLAKIWKTSAFILGRKIDQVKTVESRNNPTHIQSIQFCEKATKISMGEENIF